MLHRQVSWLCCVLLASAVALLATARSNGQSIGNDVELDAVVREAVLNKLHVARFTLQRLEPVEMSGGLHVEVVLAGQPQLIVLQRHSVRAPGFRVVVQDHDGALREAEVPQAQTYRGHVAGCGSSSVIASIVEGRIRAHVYTGEIDGTAWVIEPAQAALVDAVEDHHVVYRSEDGPMTEGRCGNQDVPAEQGPSLRPMSSATMPMDVKVCRIACDADYEYYVLNGSSVANTTADMESIINGVSVIFERDTQVSFQITQLMVRSAEPDPYTSLNVNGVLAEFRLDWKNNHADIPRDAAHLFTGKNFGTYLGEGYTDQVCPYADHYSVVRSRWQTDLSKRIALSAHEIGHTFDATHCDYDIDPRCRIMCPSIGACSVGFHSFEQMNITRIRGTAASASCLTAGTVLTPTTSLPFDDNFDTMILAQPPDPTKWTAVDLAECAYKHLEISIGRGYNYNEKLGTVRTLPMKLSGPANVSYKVNPGSIPSTHSLLIEYFDSTAHAWRTLRTIISDGSNQYSAYVDAVPTNGYGSHFAVRFSAYGTAFTSSLSWGMDDVSIVETPASPLLSIARTATNTVAISWPLPAPNGELQTTAVLTGGSNSWTQLPPPYPTNATQSVVIEPAAVGNRFYRLRSP